MKLVTFVPRTGGPAETGALDGDTVRVIGPGSLGDRLRDRLPLQPSGERHLLAEVRLCAPIPTPPSVRDFYAFEAHVRAAHRLRGRDAIDPAFYEQPVFYFSNPASVVGPDAAVPAAPGSSEIDYELELAVVIGRGGRNIPAERAWDHVLGLTILNDWSARDVQRAEMRLNLGPAKGKDFATSLGPCVVTLDELAARFRNDRHELEMLARVNGRTLSRGNAAEIYWSFPQIVALASRGVHLVPGDVIGSGTVGSGCILELRPESTGGWLRPGDVVELEVEGIGTLRNRLAPPATEYEAD